MKQGRAYHFIYKVSDIKWFPCIIMKLSFYGEFDIYKNSRSDFSTVVSLQDSRRCFLKKKTHQEIIFIFLIEKLSTLNNFMHHQCDQSVINLSYFHSLKNGVLD